MLGACSAWSTANSTGICPTTTASNAPADNEMDLTLASLGRYLQRHGRTVHSDSHANNIQAQGYQTHHQLRSTLSPLLPSGVIACGN